MKTLWMSFLLVCVSASSYAMDADFSGYLRGGTGLSSESGQKECFFNSGIPGNFLRLGNECGFYSELGFAFHHAKASAGDPFFFFTQVRLTFNSKGTRQWESAANRDMSQVEAYTKAGGLSEIPGEYWVGKRFYRDVDLNIFDWYYYADMSGVGAGVENLAWGPGKFAIAHLIQANDDLSTTTVGRPVLQAIDLRYKEISLGEKKDLNFWGAYAWAPGSQQGTQDYIFTNGYLAATRFHAGGEAWNNQLTLMYGKGALKEFNLYASSALPSTSERQNRGWAWRLVEDFHHDVTDRWAVMFGFAAEESSNGDFVNNRKQWQEIGIRPIYFVSDRVQWMLEMGYSHLKDDSEFDAGVVPVGDRELARVSIAPQLSLKKSIWGRPVMRAYVSHSFWNRGNKSFIAREAPTFGDKTEGTAFGYQFEAWF